MRRPKTAPELRTLIMDEVRRIPDCRGVRDVAIIKLKPKDPALPNWGAAWVGGKEGHSPKADAIVQRLQTEFLLVE